MLLALRYRLQAPTIFLKIVTIISKYKTVQTKQLENCCCIIILDDFQTIIVLGKLLLKSNLLTHCSDCIWFGVVNQNSLLNQIYFISLRYNEIAKYDFKKHKGNGTVGHFTQVVWRGSQKVGMGFAKVTKNEMNKIYVVARYAPAGNYVGKNAENVMPIKT